jgi:hypothetical protein
MVTEAACHCGPSSGRSWSEARGPWLLRRALAAEDPSAPMGWRARGGECEPIGRRRGWASVWESGRTYAAALTEGPEGKLQAEPKGMALGVSSIGCPPRRRVIRPALLGHPAILRSLEGC